MPPLATTAGAAALAAWLRAGGKPAHDALWRACGWGQVTVIGILAGEVLPDEGLAGQLAEVTAGAVTIEMFDRPAAPVAARGVAA